MAAFITKFFLCITMAIKPYWKDDIDVGNGETMHGIMGQEGLATKMAALYGTAVAVAAEFYGGAGEAEAREGVWVTKIKTEDGRLCGLMFNDEQKRDSALNILDSVLASIDISREPAEGQEQEPAAETEPVEVPTDEPEPEHETEPEKEPELEQEPEPEPEPEQPAKKSTRPKVIKV